MLTNIRIRNIADRIHRLENKSLALDEVADSIENAINLLSRNHPLRKTLRTQLKAVEAERDALDAKANELEDRIIAIRAR